MRWPRLFAKRRALFDRHRAANRSLDRLDAALAGIGAHAPALTDREDHHDRRDA